MKIVNDSECKVKEYQHSFWRSTLVLIMVTVMVRQTHTMLHVLFYKNYNSHSVELITKIYFMLYVPERSWF